MSSLGRRRAAGPEADVIVGIAVWVVVFALSTGPLADRVGVLEGLWLLAPLVVVPMGLALLRPPRELVREFTIARRLALPTALLVVGGILAEPGAVAAWLTAPWVSVTVLALWVGLRWFAIAPSMRAKIVVPVAGLVFLAASAAALVAWQGQLRPAGSSDVTMALVAVHAAFAGFGVAVAADRTRAAATRRRARSTAGAAGLASVAGAAVLLAGFLSDDRTIGLLGSVLLAASLLLLALVTLVYALRRERAAGASALLVVSSGSLLFALALAVQYAFARWNDSYTLSISRMLELHGTVSGLGFVVGALLGWTLAAVPDDEAI
jgi:hypothetical protein